jgi:DNA repair protein RadC
MLIREISTEQRPRERLLENGVSSLSDAELLALLLEQGSKNEKVRDSFYELVSETKHEFVYVDDLM